MAKFAFDWTNPSAQRGAYLDALQRFPQALSAVLKAMAPALHNLSYRDGGWTAHQIVAHLADSHTMAVFRIKWALTEPESVVKPYDQDAFVALPDATLPIQLHELAVTTANLRIVTILQGIKEEDFSRRYLHPEYPEENFTLDYIAAYYGWHGEHHLEQLKQIAAKG